MDTPKKVFPTSIILLALFIVSCADQHVIPQGRFPGVNQRFAPGTIPELNTVWESQRAAIESHYINGTTLAPISYNATIEGYVVKEYTCPPCPMGAQCKPCMGDNIVISEKDSLLQSYSGLSSSEFILYTSRPTQFSLGKRYLFSIAMETGKYPLLVGYDPLR